MTKSMFYISLGGFVVLLWGFLALAHRASRGGEESPIYSVRRHDPYGAAAIQELLDARAIPVDTLERSQLREGISGTLIQVVTAPKDKLGMMLFSRPRNVQQLHDWMSEGNTVVQFTSSHTELMKTCSTPKLIEGSIGDWRRFERRMGHGYPPNEIGWHKENVQWAEQSATVLSTSPETIGPPVLYSPSQFVSGQHSDWTPIAVRSGRAVAGIQKVGSGKLVVIASPTPILNGLIAEGGNLNLVLDLVGKGPVLFDEWTHGFGHGGTIMSLIRDLGLVPLILQCGFLAVLYAWSVMGRQRDDRLQRLRPRSSVEQVVTLGHIYSHALEPSAALLRCRDEALRRVSKALRCSASSIPSRVAKIPDSTKQIWEQLRSAIDPARPKPGPPSSATASPGAVERKRTENHAREILTLSQRFVTEMAHERGRQRQSHPDSPAT